MAIERVMFKAADTWRDEMLADIEVKRRHGMFVEQQGFGFGEQFGLADRIALPARCSQQTVVGGVIETRQVLLVGRPKNIGECRRVVVVAVPREAHDLPFRTLITRVEEILPFLLFELHVNAEHAYVEFLRDDGRPCAQGEDGRIVVTELVNFGMPMIRYEVGDRGVPSNCVCPCGRSLPLMERLVGRVADFLVAEDGSQVAGISLIENTLTRFP